MLTIYIFVLVFMIPAFVSLFVGTEYSDGTIRNKLIIGHTRLSIYLSNLITGVAAALIFTAAYLIAGLAVGIPLCGVTGVNYRELVTLLLLSIVTMTATVSLSTLVGMLCQSRAVTAVANILAVLFLLVMSIYISARLNEPEYYQSVTATGRRWNHYGNRRRKRIRPTCGEPNGRSMNFLMNSSPPARQSPSHRVQ